MWILHHVVVPFGKTSVLSTTLRINLLVHLNSVSCARSQAEDWATLRLGGEQPGHGTGAGPPCPTAWHPVPSAEPHMAQGHRPALRTEKDLEVASADPSELDLLRAYWMKGHGLCAFSFSIASAKVQDRLPRCVLSTLPDKPREGRGALCSPFKGSRATGGTTEAESSLSVRMVRVLANFRPGWLPTAEGCRLGRVRTAQEQVPPSCCLPAPATVRPALCLPSDQDG